MQYHADRFANGGTTNSTSSPISGTSEGTLYQTERYGSYKYEIPVTNANYSIKLHFIEMYQTSAGSRQFSVTVEGEPLIQDIDLFDQVGKDVAYDVIAPLVMVADESLTIELTPQIDNATISGFAIYSDDGGEYLEPPIPENGVDSLPYFVGNITTSGNIRSDFLQYWDQLTAENEGKWQSMEGTRDQFNWAKSDAYTTYAEQNNILYKHHTFVWGAQSPSWLNDLSGPEAKEEIEEWISAYCGRYPNIPMIDVVNEATPGHQPAAYAQRAYGNNWVTEVFKVARRECPNSVLILNDYNVLSWNTQEFIDMARNAAQSGFVDAIGLQAHGLEDRSTTELKSKLDKLWNDLRLPMYISEYDVAETNDQLQLQIFQSQFELFYNYPHIKGITIWGYIYGNTWVTGSGLIHPDGRNRPAMDWLIQYLQDNPK